MSKTKPRMNRSNIFVLTVNKLSEVHRDAMDEDQWIAESFEKIRAFADPIKDKLPAEIAADIDRLYDDVDRSREQVKAISAAFDRMAGGCHTYAALDAKLPKNMQKDLHNHPKRLPGFLQVRALAAMGDVHDGAREFATAIRDRKATAEKITEGSRHIMARAGEMIEALRSHRAPAI